MLCWSFPLFFAGIAVLHCVAVPSLMQVIPHVGQKPFLDFHFYNQAAMNTLKNLNFHMHTSIALGCIHPGLS